MMKGQISETSKNMTTLRNIASSCSNFVKYVEKNTETASMVRCQLRYVF